MHSATRRPPTPARTGPSRRPMAAWVTALIVALGLALSGVAPARAADTGVISGVVLAKPAGGVAAPMENAQVVAYQQLPGDSEAEEHVGSANTGPDGTYSITGLPAGDYEVRILPGGPGADAYAEEYYQDSYGSYDATVVQVGAGTIELDDVLLEHYGWVTGRVTDDTGAPLPGAIVSLRANPMAGGFGVTADAEGYYDTRDSEYVGTDAFPGEYLLEGSGPSSYAADDPVYAGVSENITIEPGAATVADLVLERRKTTVFSVTDAAGDPVADTPVELLIRLEPGGDFEPPQYGPIQTDELGKFRVVQGEGVAYKLRFRPAAESGGDEVPEWYDGANGSATLADAAVVSWTDASPLKQDIAVELAPLSGTAPTIAGRTRVGATLSATSGAWTPADPDLTWQWLAGGEPIAGATDDEFVLTADQFGLPITVAAMARVDDATSTATSAPTDGVARGVLSTTKPRIVGKTKVGSKLRAKAGAWGPRPVRLSYTWLRNGKVIKRARAASYKIKRADRGKRIQVRVTGKKTGYVTARVTSRAVRVKR